MQNLSRLDDNSEDDSAGIYNTMQILEVSSYTGVPQTTAFSSSYTGATQIVQLSTQ